MPVRLSPTSIASNDSGRAPAFWSPYDWLFTFSLANVCFFRTWAAILERGRHVVPVTFAIAIINVLLMGAGLRIAYYLVQRSRNSMVRWAGILAFAALILLPFHALTTVNFAGAVQKRNITYAVALIVAVLIVLNRRIRHGVRTALMIAAPFIFVTFGQSVSRMTAYDAAHWQLPKAPTTGTARSPRLVWLMFDEWDYGIAFGPRRPALPEVDRLVAESFHATNAYSPGSTTEQSVPKLVTGDKTATKTNAGTRPSVFSRAKQDGVRTAVVGWYINYCGLFSSSLDSCWTTAFDAERGSMGITSTEIAGNQLRNIFESQFRSPFGQALGAKRHVVDYKFVLRAAVEAAASSGLDFVYVHFPIPHEPLFYDSAERRFDLGEKPIAGLFVKPFERYIDALQLVDISLGEVRRAMETSGLWDKTHLLLTSDHAYRQRHRLDSNRNDDRIPFTIHLAGSSRRFDYSQRFNTIVAADLATALLRRELNTSEQVQTWIDERRARLK